MLQESIWIWLLPPMGFLIMMLFLVPFYIPIIVFVVVYLIGQFHLSSRTFYFTSQELWRESRGGERIAIQFSSVESIIGSWFYMVPNFKIKSGNKLLKIPIPHNHSMSKLCYLLEKGVDPELKLPLFVGTRAKVYRQHKKL